MYKVFYGPNKRIKINIFDKTKLVSSIKQNKIIYCVSSLQNDINKKAAFSTGNVEYYGENKEQAIYSSMLICDINEHTKIKVFCNKFKLNLE